MRHRPHQMDHLHSLNLTAMMREVAHTLGNIDFAVEVELENTDASVLDPMLKEHIKGRIRAAHREKRQPYLGLLESLRWQQHRQSFVL